MSFGDMYTELRGSVPKLPISFAPTLINRAYRTIRESNLWSFQLFESSWISPPLINSGTVTLTIGLPTVTFDATAIAALLAGNTTYSLITQRQFRSSAAGGIYSIVAMDFGTGVATLDRPYADQITGAGCSYQVYQLYYAAPYLDFLTWISVRNPSMFLNLDLTTTRAQVDATDPQRSWYQFPSRVVPLGIDLRGQGTVNASGTLGYPLFELWGQPVSPFSYQCYGIRRGVDLSSPTDTLPYSIAEDLVLAKAREYAYEWAEANKEMAPRAVGPDWKFLMGRTRADYTKLLTLYRKQDKEFVDNWLISRCGSQFASRVGYYNTLASTAGPYAMY